MEASAESTLKSLEQAAAGLLFPSESDYPLTPFRYGGQGEPTAAGLLAAEGKPEETAVEEIPLEELFDGVTADIEGADEAEKAETERWRALVALLRADLGDLRVYRVGAIDIDVYVLGRHASGEWLGLKTKVIET